MVLVATVLTACGIETYGNAVFKLLTVTPLQQYLPLAVLKLAALHATFVVLVLLVATVLTACGIET